MLLIRKHLLIAIASLKSNTKREYTYAFTVFFAISLFLVFNTKMYGVWIVFSLLFLIPLSFSPWYLLASLFLVATSFLVQMLIEPHKAIPMISGRYKIKKVIGMGFIIDVHGENVLVRSRRHYYIGDFLYVSGRINQPVNFNGFDLITYLKTMNIKNMISFPKVHLLASSGDLRNVAIKYLITGGDNYRKVAPLLVLGQKTAESKIIYMMAFKMSIIHLFVISGFHISLFFGIIYKLLTFMKINKNYASLIALFPIGVYLFFLNFPLSATRAAILITLGVANKVFLKSYFKSMEVLSITMSLMFLKNPNSVFSLSFIFTFIATYVVIFINTIKFKATWHKYLAIAIGAYLSNMFIALYINGWWSVFGVIFGAILSPIFVIVYSLSIFLFPFKSVMEYVYWAFIAILKAINELNIVVDVPSIPLWLIQLIYTLPFTYFIIKKIWNLYTETKHTWLTKNSSN